MAFAIVTDSSSNLTEEVIDQFDLHILPLTFMVDGEEHHSYLKGHKTDLKQFYTMMREGKVITTSLPNLKDSRELLEGLLASGEDVLYIGFSSGLSGTYQAIDLLLAELADAYPDRTVLSVDALAASLGVTCSIGVGTSKSVAKIASDRDKPRGLTVVFPGTEAAFLEKLPVRTLSGVGAAAEKTLLAHGVRTLGDMGRADGALLRKIFGKNGEMMRDRALGRDRSEVAEDDEVKSVSNEMTYARDLETREDIEAALSTISAKVGRRLRRKGLKGRTVAVKVRYDNRTTRSAQCALPAPTDDDIAFAPVAHRLAQELWAPGMKVRLLGVAVTHFEEDGAPVQETLFDAAALGGDDRADATQGAALIRDEKKRRSLLAATDALQERFGDGTVRFGFELRQSGNTTGSSSKNVEDYK